MVVYFKKYKYMNENIYISWQFLKQFGRAKCIAGPTTLKSGRAMALLALPIAHSMAGTYSRFVFSVYYTLYVLKNTNTLAQ